MFFDNKLKKTLFIFLYLEKFEQLLVQHVIESTCLTACSTSRGLATALSLLLLLLLLFAIYGQVLL
jgi:hypothetical protein